MSGTQINPGLIGVFPTQKSAYEYALRLNEKGVAIKDSTPRRKNTSRPQGSEVFFICMRNDHSSNVA